MVTRDGDPRRYIFVDEMGNNIVMTRLYSRAAVGERVIDKVTDDRGGNVSTIAAIALYSIRTGLSVPGPIDGDTITFFIEELLAPTLKRG